MSAALQVSGSQAYQHDDPGAPESLPSTPVRRPRPRASRGTFVAMNAGILVVGLLSLLVINTTLAQGAFEVSDLQRELRGLQEEQTSLEEAIAQRSSTLSLARAAERLGMVQVRRAAFLRLDDGRIIGRPQPVPYPVSDRPDAADRVGKRTDRAGASGGTAKQRPSTPRPGRG